MRLLFRLVHRRYIDAAQDGAGPRAFGGRWNNPGTAAIYATDSVVAGLAEVAAGLEEAVLDDLVVLPIYLPARVRVASVSQAALPGGWQADPQQRATRQAGARWLAEKESCVLEVPSASNPNQRIYLLNPAHPDFPSVLWLPPEPLAEIQDVASLPPVASPAPSPSRRRDVFLCHASEDKKGVIEPLAAAMKTARISYWLDRDIVKWGNSTTGAVNEGLNVSRFAIAVLSKTFLRKNWPRFEMNAALAEEIELGRTRLLVLLVGTEAERAHIFTQLPLLRHKRYEVWTGDAATIIAALQDCLTSSGD